MKKKTKAELEEDLTHVQDQLEDAKNVIIVQEREIVSLKRSSKELQKESDENFLHHKELRESLRQAISTIAAIQDPSLTVPLSSGYYDTNGVWRTDDKPENNLHGILLHLYSKLN